MDTKSDAAIVAEYAERMLPLASASLGDEYRYQSLPLCVMDAVFSIGIKYAIVRGVVSRYCQYTRQRRLRIGEALPPIAEQECIAAFCKRPEQSDLAAMAERVYGSRNLTSPRGGILKAEATLRFAQCLQSHGVEYLQDVPRVAEIARFEEDIRSIPGQRSGISLRYFWMLAGSDDFIKPDRMVLRFLAAALRHSVSVLEATPLLQSASRILANRFPGITPRLLDHEVWKHQSETKSVSREKVYAS